jgi:hypothetical protein
VAKIFQQIYKKCLTKQLRCATIVVQTKREGNLKEKEINKMKKYLINGEVFTFKVIEEYTCKGKHYGETCYFAVCTSLRHYGKCAWLDEQNGVQFEGEKRIIAEPCAVHGYGAYTLWGGEIRPRYNWQKTPVKNRF